ncbi:hypothetical protein [Streptomyces roseolilacinus]|uniref:hypothetical protein n=1 Tax=Streptomyces roseolilacinus TaxID=66904 RepID=UPI0038251D3F
MKFLPVRAVLPALLVVGAVGCGAVYTVATVHDADRTVPTTLWSAASSEPAEDPAADAWRGRAATPLGKLLLPVPEGFRLGPDVGEHGNDAELSAQQANTVLKESGRHLSGPQRRVFERLIDELGVKGLAVRTYATEFAPHGGVNERDDVIGVQIARLKDGAQARRVYTARTAMADRMGLDGGPKVEGHENSACHLVPERDDEQGAGVAEMECVAYTSDLLVTVSVQGMRPLDESVIADMVKEQLDHIDLPGEHV